jgi:hypothetical protein
MSQQGELGYYQHPPPFVPQYTVLTFTNHDLLAGAGADATIRAFLANADVPIVSAILWPTFTLEDAQYEGNDVRALASIYHLRHYPAAQCVLAHYWYH